MDAPTIVVAPASEPVTLDEIKAFCGVYQDVDAENGPLSLYAEAAREVVEGWTARALVTRTLREVRKVPASGVVRLLRAPISAITAVSVDGEAVSDPSTVPFEAPTSLALGSAGSTAVIEYEAGYGGPDSVPKRAKLAILYLTALAYEKRLEPGEVPEFVKSLLWSLSWGGEVPPP